MMKNPIVNAFAAAGIAGVLGGCQTTGIETPTVGFSGSRTDQCVTLVQFNVLVASGALTLPDKLCDDRNIAKSLIAHPDPKFQAAGVTMLRKLSGTANQAISDVNNGRGSAPPTTASGQCQISAVAGRQASLSCL